MKNRIDITAQRFGRLVAISPSPGYKKGYWECVCDCGQTCYADGTTLRKGGTKSCGCFRKEFGAKIGRSNTKTVPAIDWLDPDWSYLLGALHGDGCILKGRQKEPSGIHYSVGKKDIEYANLLFGLLKDKGLDAKMSEGQNGLNVVVNSTLLAQQFSPYKSSGIWSHPVSVFIPDYLAGIIDTDGTIGSTSHIISVSQKSNGNLQKIAEYFRLLEIDIKQYRVNSCYKEKPYPVDCITVCDAQSILNFANRIALRHYRKINSLDRLVQWAISVVQQKSVPTIEKQIVDLLSVAPRSGEDICSLLNITLTQMYNAIRRLRQEKGIDIVSKCVPNSKRLYFMG